MQIPGSLPVGQSLATRVTRAYGLPGQVGQPRPADDAKRAPGVTEAATEAAVGSKPTDAQALRAVLSEDERAYFDQIAQLGPITYGPGRQRGMTPDAPRGLRLDVTG